MTNRTWRYASSEDPFASPLVLAMRLHLRVVTHGDGFASTEAFPFRLPRKRGKRSTDWCRGPRTAPVTRYSRDPFYGTAHLSVLHYADCRDFRLNPARASASWNHRMQTGVPHSLSGASAASTWQSEHVPDGHDAQAVRE